MIDRSQHDNPIAKISLAWNVILYQISGLIMFFYLVFLEIISLRILPFSTVVIFGG